MTKRNNAVLVGSVMVVTGFFFSWVGIRGLGSVTGWEIHELAKEIGGRAYLFYLLPLGAVLAGLASLTGVKTAGQIAFWIGAITLAWFGFEALRLMFNHTFMGLWITGIGVITMFIAGLATRKG